MANEIREYEYFIDFINDLDLEMNDYLKLNFLMFTTDDKTVFSILNFASDPKINKNIFEDTV